MSFLKNAIRDGLRKGIGDAIGKAVKEVVEPAAAKLANDTAEAINNTSAKTREAVRQTSGWDTAFDNLQRSMEGYVTEAAKNIKICPKCEAPASAEQSFCAHCGAKLPDITAAQGAVCSNCGRQNTVGTKFCSACGMKLPAAVQEEQEITDRDAAVMNEWEDKLPQFPRWTCGGSDFALEFDEPNCCRFIPNFFGEVNQAHAAVVEYRQILLQNGFRKAGEYPTIEHLYKMQNGVCYHVDTEHCFDGDPDCPTIGFDTRKPYGGFDYIKPEPKKKVSIFDLIK